MSVIWNFQSNEEGERKSVTKLLAKMFSEKESTLASDNKALWLCFLGRWGKSLSFMMHSSLKFLNRERFIWYSWKTISVPQWVFFKFFFSFFKNKFTIKIEMLDCLLKEVTVVHFWYDIEILAMLKKCFTQNNSIVLWRISFKCRKSDY